MKPFSIFSTAVAAPGAFTLALALLATPAPAQVSDQMIDDWADGVQEFMPDEPALPLDELLESRPDSAASAPAQTAPADTAIADEPAQLAQGEGAAAPAGWDRHEHFGLSVALPPEFELLDEGRNEVLLGALDFETETGIIAFIGLERQDEILGDAEIIDQEAVQLADGSVFTRFDLAIDDSAFRGVALGLLEQTAIPGEVGAAILVTLFNMDWDNETRALAERILGTVEYQQPERDLASGLGGLLSYALPDGWRVQRDRANFIDLLHGGMAGPSLNIGTGEPGRDMASLNRRVFGELALITGDFNESEGEILGHRARIFEGASAWVSGWQSRVHVLNECAPGNNPIVIDTIMRDAAQQAQIDALLAQMTLNLPEDMAPCPEALAPGTSWEREGRFAISQVEGLDGYTFPGGVGLAPADRDQRFPALRISVDHPSEFNSAFQLGNRLGAGFADPPLVDEAELGGHSAYRFVGASAARNDSWSVQAYLLHNCMADDVPIVVTMRREADDPLAGAAPDPMLEHVFIDLPDDAPACPAELFEDAFERVQARPDTAPQRPEPAAPAPSAEQPGAAPPAPGVSTPDASEAASTIRTAPTPRFEPQGFAGRLDNDHRRQRYAIDLPANGTLLLDVTTGEGLNLFNGVRIFDSDGETQLFSQSHGPDRQREYEVTHLRAGRYYLDLIKDSRAFYEGDYRVRTGFRPVSVPGEREPNDEPGQAVPLELGLLVSGHLGFRGQGREADREDWYVLDLPRDGTLVLHVTTSGDASGRDPIRPDDGNLNLYGGVFVMAGDGETRLYGTRHLTGREQEHVIEDLAAGRYFIRVVKDGRAFYWGSYTLHARIDDMPAPIVPDPWPWSEPDEDQTAATPPPAQTQGQEAGAGWTRYVNARFGTAVEYPGDLFNALPPPANDDGRAFETPDGAARFRVFAGHNLFEQSLAELMGEAIGTGTLGQITSAELLDDRAVIAGRQDGRMHLRVILDQPEAGIVHRLMFDHDEAAAARFAPIAERMADSFTIDQAAPIESAAPAPDAAADAVELAFWQSIADSQDPAEFQAYLDRWPQGVFAALAENRLRRLAPEAAPQQAPQEAQPAPPRRETLPPPPPPNPQAYSSPRPGTSERAAIMDAARIPISEALGQRVVFVDTTLRSSGTWAYLAAVPQLPDGQPLDWTRTPYRDAWRADAMSDLVMVLMVNDGTGWRAIRHVIGPTDVHWLNWVDELRLPEALFFGR